MSVLIHIGDALAVMREMAAGSVDAIVTDPPYHLAAKKGGMVGFVSKNWDGGDVAFRSETWAEAMRLLKPGGHLVSFGGTRTYHRLACAIEDAGFEIRDQLAWTYSKGFPKSLDVGKKVDGWQGWGTALKPAWEPICLARKALVGTVSDNVVAHGVGALNIDGCRIETTDNLNGGAYAAKGGRSAIGGDERTAAGQGMFQPGKTAGREFVQPTGRWPANLIHDGEAGLGENGRFFHCAKAGRTDRGEGNDHPTVKPTELMRWLCRLVTPPGGLVLDPFAGSGSTGRGAVLEGFRFVGIEIDEGYAAIARQRVGAVADAGEAAA